MVGVAFTESLFCRRCFHILVWRPECSSCFIQPPALTLIRAGYRVTAQTDMAFGFLGSAIWSTIAYWWGLRVWPP
jgi:hypothetical protein